VYVEALDTVGLKGWGSVREGAAAGDRGEIYCNSPSADGFIVAEVGTWFRYLHGADIGRFGYGVGLRQ